MAWQLSDASSIPETGRTDARRFLVFDKTLGRWRWGFRAALEPLPESCTEQEALRALAPLLKAAEEYIDSNPPDGTVFGIIGELGSGALPGPGQLAKAGQSRKNADSAARREVGPDVPEWQQGAFIAAAIEILFDLLRVENPNDLAAACLLARYLRVAGRRRDAFAECCDVYCRALSLGSVLERASAQSTETARVSHAYQKLLNDGLVWQIADTCALLGLAGIVDRARMDRLLPPNSPVLQVAAHLVSEANWITMVTTDASHMGYFQFVAGTVHQYRKHLLTLLKLSFDAGVSVHPPAVKDAVLKSIALMDRVMTRSKSQDVRIAASDTLEIIHLQESIDVLKKYSNDDDLAFRQRAQIAIATIQQALFEASH
jgi:hypothetical protein